MGTIAQNATKPGDVAQSATSVTIKAAGVGTSGYVIWNDSATDLYLRCGSAAATTTDFTWKIPAGDYLQEPSGDFLYIGQITGIWGAAGAGAARVTLFGV